MCLHPKIFTGLLNALVGSRFWIGQLQLQLIPESLVRYMTTDGKWHPAADSPIGSSFPRPPRNTSAGVPPVCLWWTSRKTDGACCYHRRGQRWGQVRHQLLLILGNIFDVTSCDAIVNHPLPDTESLKSCWRRAFHLSKCRPFSQW